VVETGSHTWTCPTCGRRVPLRADACHCGTTQERARQLASAAPAAPRPARRPRPGGRAEALAVMTRDVKVLLVAGALVVVAGVGWLVFPSPRVDAARSRLVDKGRRPRAHASPHPPFRLPGGSRSDLSRLPNPLTGVR
jgi:hypothetical protein